MQLHQRQQASEKWLEVLHALFLLDLLPCTALLIVGHLIAQLAAAPVNGV